MRVLITGSDGYIGSVLAPIVRDAGHEVRGLDSFLFEGCALGPEPGEIAAARCDIRDVDISHLRGFDAVVHLAGIANDPLGYLDPERTYEINHLASVRLGWLAREAGVPRFIHASSCSTYGAAAPDDLLTEAAEFNPLTPYGESKVRAERDLSRLADDRFSPVFLRNATVYGFSPRLRLDLIVNDFVASAFVAGEVLIRSDGTPWRPLVHIRDVASAVLAALEAPPESVHNQAFNIGRTSENYQVRDVADLVADALPGTKVTYEAGGGPDPRSYRVDFSKAERGLPGFRPRWTVRDGIAELVDEYGRHGLTRDERSSDRFIRLLRIQTMQHTGSLGHDFRPLSELRPGAAGV
jgi:nucleoside-diphosphate-sugar epimerase